MVAATGEQAAVIRAPGQKGHCLLMAGERVHVHGLARGADAPDLRSGIL